MFTDPPRLKGLRRSGEAHLNKKYKRLVLVVLLLVLAVVVAVAVFADSTHTQPTDAARRHRAPQHYKYEFETIPVNWTSVGPFDSVRFTNLVSESPYSSLSAFYQYPALATHESAIPRSFLIAAKASNTATSTSSTTCDTHLSANFILQSSAQPELQCSSEVNATAVSLSSFFVNAGVSQLNALSARLGTYKGKAEFFSKWQRDYQTKGRRPGKTVGMHTFPLPHAYPAVDALLADVESPSIRETVEKKMRAYANRTGVSVISSGAAFQSFEISNRSSVISKETSVIQCGVLDKSIPHRYCDAQNISIQSSNIPEVKRNRKSGLDLPAPFGAVEASCNLDEDRWFQKGFGSGAAGWMRDALNTFMVYSLLHLNAENTQIILLDSRLSDGPFTIAWSHIFSSSHRLLDIRQLKNKIRKDSGNNNARLCFKRAVWGIHGGISPLHRGGTSRSRCKNAPLLHAFKDFMTGRIRTAVFGAVDNVPWRSLKVPKMHQLQLDRDVEKLEHKLLADNERITQGAKMRQITVVKASVITITYAVRSAPVHNANALGEANVLKYPQKHGFDDVDPSSLRQSANNTKPISRQIQNDDEVQSRIRDAAQAWESQQRSQLRDIRVQFRAVNFGALSFIDQVAIAQGTDFFIGPHGASFAHLLYLRQLPKAAVLELRPPTRNIGNEQFRNLAVRMHHLYEKIPYGIGSRKPNVNLRVSGSELKVLDLILPHMLDALLMARIKQ
ncbi:hypothetical protein HDU77_006783 [Chytriomyces hyalinus]|nr:hypothetical protein HDU77_006783 [Chytriomyces hyalinus]